MSSARESKFSTVEQESWFCDMLDGWTTEIKQVSPSEWAESRRYLPPSVTSRPGYFSFAVTPYMREPLDCLDVDSPIREVHVMKGVQIAYTTAVLENFIGYSIEVVKSQPLMLVTADAELAKLRMEGNLTPMFQQSGLDKFIQSDDETNTRKTGKTDRRVAWQGGGYLVPFGAQNANKLRSISVWGLANDENDGWPLSVGRDGDPYELTKGRTKGYEQSRKILNGSTPTIKGISKIEKLFAEGDQRKYFVPCLECGHMQVLKWRREDPKTGEVTGITWETNEHGEFVYGSARYVCETCSHAHANDDKTRMLDPANGAEWRPTAKPVAPHVRSYHVSALYSPPGMQSWDACVLDWLAAWDPVSNRCKDTEKLQVFYNNILGETFELRGDKLKSEQVTPHRMPYQRGTVPNRFAVEKAGSPILFLACTVDVQRDWLAVGVFGFAKGSRCFLVDYLRFDGDCQNPDDPTTWGALQELMLSRVYAADDGRRYGIAITAVDSGYLTDHVVKFCERFDAGVVYLKGRDNEGKNSYMRHFKEMTDPQSGARGYMVTVDRYKDRLHAALRVEWDRIGVLPERHWSAPSDIKDSELKELTVETKREKINATTGKREGFYWHRPGGVRNELWDLSGYAYFLHDLLAYDVCPPNEKVGEFLVDYDAFWAICEDEGIFLAP